MPSSFTSDPTFKPKQNIALIFSFVVLTIIFSIILIGIIFLYLLLCQSLLQKTGLGDYQMPLFSFERILNRSEIIESLLLILLPATDCSLWSLHVCICSICIVLMSIFPYKGLEDFKPLSALSL